MTASWIQLDTSLYQLTQTPTNCLLFIDPQRENANQLAQLYIQTTLCKQPLIAPTKGSSSQDEKSTITTSPLIPCQQCQSCRLITQGIHPDIFFALQALKVSEVRDLIQKVTQTPSLGAHRFIYLATIEQYNEHALNALLKTLEEPTSHSHFILSTTSRHAVKATILSRARILNVPQPNEEQSLQWLIENGWEEKHARTLLPLYHNNPYQTHALRDHPNPLDILPDLIAYCAAPQKHTSFLQKLIDIYNKKDHILIEHLALNLENIIRLIQQQYAPENWQNNEQTIKLLAQIDVNEIHSLYTAINRLRRMSKNNISMAINTTALLLTHINARKPTL